eukprot:COSAG01_NODE_1356_length_10592_cov_4.971995_7_plen_93_part_00
MERASVTLEGSRSRPPGGLWSSHAVLALRSSSSYSSSSWRLPAGWGGVVWCGVVWCGVVPRPQVVIWVVCNAFIVVDQLAAPPPNIMCGAKN